MPAAEPKRDRWGRYLLPDPETGEERAWTRATTISGILSDRYNIELWAQRMVALGLAKRGDLLALVKTKGDDKKELNRIVKDAKEAGGASSSSNLGTAIHAACEAMDKEEPFEIQPPYDMDVKAYAAKRIELALHIVPGWVERIVLVPELGIAGTLDRMFKHKDWKHPRIADLKTGATVHFAELEHSIQQAIYANATHYWDEDEAKLVPIAPGLIDKDKALIVHLPAGQGICEIHELDIRLGWEAAKVAAQVKAWRGDKSISKPYEEESR